MKILFIGARLFDDVAYYTRKLGLETIISESNPDAPNLNLADSYHIVPRGMDAPFDLALKEDVDAVVPLIGIDGPLIDLGQFKDKLEEDYGIPVVASNMDAALISCNKKRTKNFFIKNKIKTPFYKLLYGEDGISNLNFPLVLKQEEGQGGKGIIIAKNMRDVNEYFKSYSKAIIEEFICGFEISVEVLGWKGDIISLVPVFKGKTTISGIHPLDKVKSAPANIKGMDNEIIRRLAHKITENLGSEGITDVDLIFNPQDDELYAIEMNTRPSGTRYLTAAASDIHPLNQLIDMAIGEWNSRRVKENLKKYFAMEYPVGEYQGDEGSTHKIFQGKNSWVVHGPPHYKRVTIRSENCQGAMKTARKLRLI